jgi:hypothetical protein
VMQPNAETVTLRDRVLRMKAELDAILAELPEHGPPAAPTQHARYMTVPGFASMRGYSARTVRDYCDLGMPHTGEGKGRRVHVAEAIAWLEAGGPKRERLLRRPR